MTQTSQNLPDLVCPSASTSNLTLAGSTLSTASTKALDRASAAQRRAARKEARLARARTLSESSDEALKGILKHPAASKRSVSECIDEMSDFMHGLTLGMDDNFGSSSSNLDQRHHHHDSTSSADDDEINSSNTTLANAGDEDLRPKKTVRFDDRAYQTFYIASPIFEKIHFSTRHHPPRNKRKNKKKS